MKKIILLITILFVSVISTACINNLAVQELNNKAQEYLAKGETEKAISRLRSSIDLDDSIFETHYNLGVALIQSEEYSDAQASLKTAIELKPDFADAYYSLAVACEGEADKIIAADSETVTVSDENEQQEKKQDLSASDKVKVVALLNASVDNYNQYLIKATNSPDKDKITAQIDYINKQIAEYNSLNSSTDLSKENISTTSDEDVVD